MLNLFKTKSVPALLHDFIGYILHEKEGKIVEGTLISHIRIDTWICRCIKLLTVKDYRGCGRQEEFHEMFSRYVKLATKQLIGNKMVCEELYVPVCVE